MPQVVTVIPLCTDMGVPIEIVRDHYALLAVSENVVDLILTAKFTKYETAWASHFNLDIYFVWKCINRYGLRL